MADQTCNRVLDADEPGEPGNRCPEIVNAESVETSLSEKPVVIFLCPKCDMKPDSMEKIQQDGWMTGLPMEGFDEEGAPNE